MNLEKNQLTKVPLGLTLTETHGGRALVQKVVKDGIANIAGISPGDYIIGIGNNREWRYSKVLFSITEWANIKPADMVSSSNLNNKPNKKSNKSSSDTSLILSSSNSITLKVTLFRPQWHPDAFILHSLLNESTEDGGGGNSKESLKMNQRKRTQALLRSQGHEVRSLPMPVSGSGSNDWRAFMVDENMALAPSSEDYMGSSTIMDKIVPSNEDYMTTPSSTINEQPDDVSKQDQDETEDNQDNDDDENTLELTTTSTTKPAVTNVSELSEDSGDINENESSSSTVGDETTPPLPGGGGVVGGGVVAGGGGEGGGGTGSWLSVETEDEWVGKKPTGEGNVSEVEDNKVGFFSKVGSFFSAPPSSVTPPVKKQITGSDEGSDGRDTDDEYSSGSGSEGDYSDDDDEGEEDEDEEDDEDTKLRKQKEAETEAEAEARVKALLFSHLAVKRESDFVGIKYDLAPSSSASEPIIKTTLKDNNDNNNNSNTNINEENTSKKSDNNSSSGLVFSPSSFMQREQPNCKVIVFTEESMGMTLNKGDNDEAIVKEVNNKSPAYKYGVLPGDVILGINSLRTSDFNEILWVMRHAERPMHLLLYSKPK
eukprot:CAMPEP_0114343182 /NCGR_PEP_ID=MMETSP0101-20121206/10397_1 /TAXON_ID=38822 ORGANISM="Pteridomonas danica, Strain PT" /NCGR_SAMPLE_ID=MMETSP0101 /ASSEMBLY_ACC=CAM_ASM_000211 /LENGTH=597 /DNA_ID=CAMNT_0001477741 /DNA_START=478 /DNA_END=2271 /DNA_ORIENTATION=+